MSPLWIPLHRTLDDVRAMTSRNVTDDDLVLLWDEESGRNDPRQRFALYRLCEGDLQLIATCESPEAAGVALVTLGREGEWDDCPVGLLDRAGEVGRKWLIRPWLPSPRNVSDAGRMLRSSRESV